MHRCLTALVLLLLCAAPMRADVTVTQTLSIEGGMTAAVGGVTPRMVMRIKGTTSRTDVDVMDQSVSTIVDLAAKRLIVLNGANRTAQVFGAGAPALPTGQVPPMPEIDMTSKPTGQSRLIEGAQCEEHAFTMRVNFAEMASAKMPPEATAAMKDVRLTLTGSVWAATSGPGVAEFVAFQKAATQANMLAAVTGMRPGGQSGALDRLVTAASAAAGLPYLTEMIMTFEGTGKVVEMMKLMGPMKMTQRVTSVSTDPIPDEMFVVPEGYTTLEP